jgi:putative peptide zinc metalloprotease protein
MRSDLEVKRARDTDEGGFIVTDLHSGELFEFSEEDYFLLRCMDGRSGLETTMQLFEQRFAKRIGEKQLRLFLSMVHEWGLVENGSAWASEQSTPAREQGDPAGDADESQLAGSPSEEDYEDLLGELGSEYGLEEDGLSGEVLGAGVAPSPRGPRFSRAGSGGRAGGMGGGGLGGRGGGMGGGGRGGPPGGGRGFGSMDSPQINSFADLPEEGMWAPFEKGTKKLSLELFSLHGASRFVAAALRPFRLLLLLLPVLAGVGLATVMNNLSLVVSDLTQYREPFPLAVRIMFSLVTVNLITELSRGVIAAGLGGQAKTFGIRLVFGIIPRFHNAVAGISNFSRRNILWLYGGPLLVRTVVFGIGILTWWATRETGTLLPGFAIILALVSVVSLVFSCNPLGPNSDGYHVLAGVVQVPDLRKRANRALISKIRGRTPLGAEENSADNGFALRAYAMGSLLFLLMLTGAILWMVGHWLEFNYQGTGVAIFLVLLAYVTLYLRGQVRDRKEKLALERQESRAERMRAFARGEYRGGVPAVAGATSGGMTPVPAGAGGGRGDHPKHHSNPLIGWVVLVIIGVVAMLPYDFQPGGPVEIMPAQRRDVHSEIAGLLEEVLVEGGQLVQKGTVIARISAAEEQRGVQTARAEIAEQQAILEELTARPRVEDVKLAEQQLETARVQLRFSTDEVDRLKGLSDEGFVSVDDYQEAVRRREVDRAEVAEAEANLARVSRPADPKEIEAAQAKLEGLRQDLAYYEGQLERTVLRMPFDGRVVTINLKDREGQFLEKGDFFATVENAAVVRVQFRIQQADVSEIKIGGETLVKFWAYPNRRFTGEIVDISTAVEEGEQGNVVIVTTLIPNEDGVLKSGMTGFGKVKGERKTVLVAFSRAIVRFFLVEMWSWLP